MTFATMYVWCVSLSLGSNTGPDSAVCYMLEDLPKAFLFSLSSWQQLKLPNKRS